jgi:hypothetical protein
MELKAFVQSNNKQLLGAKIAKFCLVKELGVETSILNVDEMSDLGLEQLRYKRSGKWHNHNSKDLQSFTLVRFLPPTLLDFKGFAIVIDPDIFALRDLSEILEICKNQDFSIAARRKNSFFDSSVMIINCESLRNQYSWNSILEALKYGKLDYVDLMSLNLPGIKIFELEQKYNSYDSFDPQTLFLHTTNRITQPWKTGLKIDFTRTDPGKYLGIISKKIVLKIFGNWPSRYQPHPSKEVESKFFSLVRLAMSAGVLTIKDIEEAISLKTVRPDFKKLLNV